MAKHIEREKLLKDLSETVVFTVRKGSVFYQPKRKHPKKQRRKNKKR